MSIADNGTLSTAAGGRGPYFFFRFLRGLGFGLGQGERCMDGRACALRDRLAVLAALAWPSRAITQVQCGSKGPVAETTL